MADVTPNKLSELVEWYIQDRNVEIRFEPVVKNPMGVVRIPGKVAPEFLFCYFLEGRRITDKALAMLIMMELLRMNYSFNLARVIAALMELSWRNYVANQPYPDWMDNKPAEMKRPRGRPRKRAPRMTFPINTATPE